MNTSEGRNTQEAPELLRQHSKKQIRTALLMMLTVAALFILPFAIPSPWGVPAMGFGAAALFSLQVRLRPDSFRSRNGSLRTAACLVAGLWIAALAITLLVASRL